MTERHTGVNIGQEILGICDEFDVGTKVALVTDNASNMAIAAKECDMTHVNCFSHTLQLAIEDGLKIDQISKTLSVSRKLVGHFSHSSLALLLLCIYTQRNISIYYRTQSANQSDCTDTAPTHK